MNTSHTRIFFSIAAIIFGVAAAQAADQPADIKPAKVAEPPRQPQDFSKVEIKTTKLADDFYTLEGQGGTISVLTGPDGILLVDSQFAPLTEKLVAAIKKISDKPIRFLVNTHVHGDHTGGNENFASLASPSFRASSYATAWLTPVRT